MPGPPRIATTPSSAPSSVPTRTVSPAAAQLLPAVVQRAQDLLEIHEVAAHDGHPVHLEPLIGQIVDRPFGVGVVIEGRDHLAGGLVGPHRRGSNR